MLPACKKYHCLCIFLEIKEITPVQECRNAGEKDRKILPDIFSEKGVYLVARSCIDFEQLGVFLGVDSRVRR